MQMQIEIISILFLNYINAYFANRCASCINQITRVQISEIFSHRNLNTKEVEELFIFRSAVRFRETSRNYFGDDPMD
jgi:hypothetical protein